MAFWRYNEENKEWLHIPAEEAKDTDIKLEEKLIPILDAAKKRLEDDDDFAMIVFGPVGSGKSTLGRLCCRYVSNEKFNPRFHMVRDVNDIEWVINKAKKKDAIVFDEASGIFSSKDSMTKKTKYAEQVLDVCRQKNLFIVIIAPSMARLSTAVALERTLVALRTYRHKQTKKRGHFCFYGTRAKEKLYIEAKKTYGTHRKILPKWHGEFGMEITHDEEYRKVKDETLKKTLASLNGEKKREKTEYEIKVEAHKDLVFNNPDVKSKDLAKILGVTERTIQKWRKDFREAQTRIKLMDVYSDTLDFEQK